MPRLPLSFAIAALPATAAALDVSPTPASAAASPLGAVVLAIAALVAGIWFIRRRRGR